MLRGQRSNGYSDCRGFPRISYRRMPRGGKVPENGYFYSLSGCPDMPEQLNYLLIPEEIPSANPARISGSGDGCKEGEHQHDDHHQHKKQYGNSTGDR